MAITFQQSGLKLITAPSVKPISLSEARDHLRVSTTDEDSYINLVIASAVDYYQREAWLQLIAATYEFYLDKFPNGSTPIELPLPPMQSITSIIYVDTDGNTQTWDSSKYELDTSVFPGKIRPINSESYPGTNDQFKAVIIKFKAGYGDSSTEIPDTILSTLKLLISYLYDHRDFVIPQKERGHDLPMGIVNMIQKNSVKRFV